MAAIKKKRIGETLVDAGAISPEQLAKALETQVVFGGRLGTNLVELSYMSLDELADQTWHPPQPSSRTGKQCPWMPDSSPSKVPGFHPG